MMFVYENIIDYFLSPLFFSFGLSLITLSCVLKMPPTLSKRRTTPSLALLPPSSLFVRASPLRNTFLPPHLCCQKCLFYHGLVVRCEVVVAGKDKATRENFEYTKMRWIFNQFVELLKMFD